MGADEQDPVVWPLDDQDPERSSRLGLDEQDPVEGWMNSGGLDEQWRVERWMNSIPWRVC